MLFWVGFSTYKMEFQCDLIFKGFWGYDEGDLFEDKSLLFGKKLINLSENML